MSFTGNGLFKLFQPVHNQMIIKIAQNGVTQWLKSHNLVIPNPEVSIFQLTIQKLLRLDYEQAIRKWFQLYGEKDYLFVKEMVQRVTKNATKNVFGWYKDKLVREWVNLQSKFRQGNLYLVQLGNRLNRLTTQIIPSQKQHIHRLTSLLDRNHKKIIEYQASYSKYMSQYQRRAAKIGYGRNDLPSICERVVVILNEVGKRAINVWQALDWYASFCEGRNLQCKMSCIKSIPKFEVEEKVSCEQGVEIIQFSFRRLKQYLDQFLAKLKNQLYELFAFFTQLLEEIHQNNQLLYQLISEKKAQQFSLDLRELLEVLDAEDFVQMTQLILDQQYMDDLFMDLERVKLSAQNCKSKSSQLKQKITMLKQELSDNRKTLEQQIQKGLQIKLFVEGQLTSKMKVPIRLEGSLSNY